MVSEPVLITGATGFLGGHAARTLAADGYEVIGLGRDPRRGAALQRDGVRFAPVDLSDRDALARICRGVGAVVHSAALSSAWAPRREFHRVNVEGTANLLAAATAAGVCRFVHISTPAVLSRLEHQLDLAESEPLPPTHTSPYGASKAVAERLVSASPLDTVILRPKAIYGPGDTALMPRLITAARKGRLPIIGDGDTLTDFTHVSDVTRAIRCVLEAPDASGIYHVAGPEPVPLWQMISLLLPMLGLPAPTRRISIPRAMRAAAVLEWTWRLLPLPGEPPLTRYSVAAIGYSQTLDTTRIRTELGYRPRVQGLDGLVEVVSAYTATPAPPDSEQIEPARPVEVGFALGGRMHPPGWALGGRSLGRTLIPVVVAAITHPDHGVVLFDTGAGAAAPGSRWWSWYRWLLHPEPIGPGPMLAALGIEPAQVGAIILSHFDPDHTGGLAGIPAGTVYCSAGAWADVAERQTGSLRRRIPPDWLPADLAARITPIDAAGSPGGFDLFGDRSIVLVPLEGHTPGHLGARITATDGTDYLLCGDAVWTTRELTKGPSWTARIIARNRAVHRATHRELAATLDDHAGLVVVPSHCPAAADRALGSGWRTSGQR